MSLSQAQAFALTQLIEVPLIMLMAHYYHVKWQRSLGFAVLASTLTHPLAWWFTWFINVIVFSPHRWVWFAITEGTVWLVESVILSKGLRLSWAKGLYISAVANAHSAGFGLCL